MRLVALWQIYDRYGMAMFAAVGGLIFFIVLNVLQGKWMGMIRGKIAKLADTRIRLLGELIRSMRVVKMYVWEGHFLQKLIQSRKNELVSHRTRLASYGAFDSLSRTSRFASFSLRGL